MKIPDNPVTLSLKKNLLLSSLLLAIGAPAGATQALPMDLDGQWSPWQPLGSGYLARRRIPKKLDLPVAERKLQAVQLRGQMHRISSQPITQKAKNNRTLWLRTGAAGLYRVGIADLAAALGTTEEKLRENADKGKISLRVGGALAPWYWDEAEDAFLFPAARYETFYTDRNAYLFHLGDQKGQAWEMQWIDGTPAAPASGPRPFPAHLHFEEEPDLRYSTWTVAQEPDADYWFWDYLYGGYKDRLEIPLQIPYPAEAGTANIRVTLRGFTDLIEGPDHQVLAELVDGDSGAVLGSGSAVWDGFEEAQIQFSVDQAIFNPDGNHRLVLTTEYAPGTHPGEWLDAIDVEYQRLSVAQNNQLWMRAVSGGTQQVAGLTTEDLFVIQDPEGQAALLENVLVEPAADGGWQVSFRAQEGADYLVVGVDTLKTPEIAPDDRIEPDYFMDDPLFMGNPFEPSPASLLIALPVDYLIIAPKAFASTAEALADYEKNRFGRVAIVWLEAIYNSYSYGRVDPSALSRFMKRFRRRNGAPEYVMLVGKGTLDEKNRMGYGDSFLPIRMVSTPWALAASDERLLGLEESGATPLPFAIGRIPITNDAEGLAYVEKLIAQEETLGAPARRTALLAADNPDDGGDFHTNSDALADRLFGLGFERVTKVYHPQDDVSGTLSQSDAWELGYLSYDGHGSAAQIGNYQENFLNANIAGSLQNAIHPLFTALSCAVADDTQPGIRSLAGALVLNPEGGAIASLAPTGLSLDGEAQILSNSFVDALFGTWGQSIGKALVQSEQENRSRLSEYMPHIYSIVGDPSVLAW